MTLAYNVNRQTLPSKIYLCRPFGDVLYELNSVQPDSVSITLNLNNISTLEFTIDRYVDGVEANGYEAINKSMEILVTGYGRFICSSPTYNNDGIKETKTIQAESLECELQNKLLVGFKVNTGVVDSLERLATNNLTPQGYAIEYVTFYNENNKELSLMDLVLEKCPGWTIGYIDPAIKNNKYSFTVDSQDVYSFLTTKVAKDAECVFYFDTLQRTINAIYKDNIGEDTNIVVGFRNLLQSVDMTVVNEDNIATKFYVQGGEDLNIQYVNFGTNYIDNIDWFLNENYFKPETIQKYKQFLAYRETRRQEFTNKSIEYSELLSDKKAKEYALPIDGSDYTQWDSSNLETLDNEYVMYEAMLQAFQSTVEGNDTKYFELSDSEIKEIGEVVDTYLTTIDDDEKASCEYLITKYSLKYQVSFLYIVVEFKDGSFKPNKIIDPSHRTPYMLLTWKPDDWDTNYKHYYTYDFITDKYTKVTGETAPQFEYATYYDYLPSIMTVDHNYYMHQLDDSNGGYYTYFEILKYVLPNIQIARYNYYLIDDKKIKYSEEYLYDWKLYGSVELRGKIDGLKQQLEALEKYQKPYSELTDDERVKNAPNGEDAYNIKHNEYMTIKERLDTAKAQLSVIESEIDEIDHKLNAIENDRAQIISDVTLKQDMWIIDEYGQRVNITFSDKEFGAINSLFHETGYSNDNIIKTSLDDAVAKEVERQKELYEDAVNKLYEYARPQYHFESTLDNLLGLPEFEHWHDEIQVGNFIRLYINDEHMVKLRLTSITVNPLDYSSDISVTYSDMVRGMRDRNDFTALFDNASGGTNDGIQIESTQKDSTSVSTELLNMIANSSVFNTKFNVNSINATESVFNTVNTEYLSTQFAQITEAQMEKLTANTAFIKYLDANLIQADTLVARMAQIDKLQAEQAWIGTGYLEYLQATSAAVVTQTVDTAFVKNLIAGKITASELFTNYFVVGSDDYGSVEIAGSTMQFKDKDGTVFMQMGTDAQGGHSIGIFDKDGTMLIDKDGVKSEAIADGLIVDNMVARAGSSSGYMGISADKLNLNQLGYTTNAQGDTVLKSSMVYFDSEDQSLNTKMSSMTTSIENVDNKIKYYVVITSSNGATIESSTTLTATVYDYGTTTPSTGTFTYKWYKNGTEISGQTAKTLAVTLGKDEVGASYSCTVGY